MATEDDNGSAADDAHFDGVEVNVEPGREVRPAAELMAAADTSILTKAIVISLIAHVILIGITSFGLYRDWGEYGLKMPHEIKAEKMTKAREAEEERRAEARRKADAERAAERAKADAEAAKAPKPPPKAGDGAAATEGAAEGAAEGEHIPSVVKDATEVDPVRPGDSGVDLDADFNLE